MPKSTVIAHPSKPSKPAKPRPDFPLYAHASGRWAKRVRGKIEYFGSWRDDPKGVRAIEQWLDEKEDLLAGRTPRVKGDGLTVAGLCNRFLSTKQGRLDSGEITRRTFTVYFDSCKKVIDDFGRDRLVEDLASDDFEQLRAKLANGRGPVAFGNDVRHIRMLFKYGYEAGLIDRPVRFGPNFTKPSKAVLRRAKQGNGKRLFEVAELRQILDEAEQPLRAMILLGCNAAIGNTDIATLPLSAVDLDSGWLDFPRVKTSIDRRCRLWPETVESLKEVISTRPAPKDPADDDKVFLTKYGRKWVKLNKRGTVNDSVAKTFAKLLKRLGLKRLGVNFYACRHTFRTVADEARDQPAAMHVMGHTDPTMSGIHRQRISDERLAAVSEYVRRWLFDSGE